MLYCDHRITKSELGNETHLKYDCLFLKLIQLNRKYDGHQLYNLGFMYCQELSGYIKNNKKQ